MTCNCKNKCNKPLRQYKENVMKELKNRLDKCFIGSEEIQRTVENSYWEMIKDMLNIKTDKSPTDEEYTVHLKSNGKKTKASLYHNGKHVCSAKATAHKEDEQDFNVGASLALKRLLEKATLLDDIEDIEKDIEYKEQQKEQKKKQEIREVLSNIEKGIRAELKRHPYLDEMTKFLNFKDLCSLLIGTADEIKYDENKKA